MKNSKLLLTVFLLCLVNVLFAQRTITGSVKDLGGTGLIGATIQIEGTTKGTTSDYEGKFSLEIEDANVTLVISYIGFVTQQIEVEQQSVLDIVLEENFDALEEVVVVGYGTIKKSDLTGAVSSVDTEQIQKIATVDINRAIQGRVAGVQVTTNSGAPGAGTTVRVRGIGSVQNSNPLYVVDGFLTGDISNITPNDIESMEVLKDASALAIYGSRGANGVVIITTKKGLKNGVEVDFNAYVGTQSAWNTLNMLDAKNYALAYLESVGRIGDINETDLKKWIQDAGSGTIQGTDWQKEVLQDAPIQSYDVSIRGGFKKLRYKVGGAYFDQVGIVENTFGKRKQANANLEYDVLDNLTISAGIKYATNEWTSYDQGTYSSILGTALRKDPINPITEPSTGHWDRTGLTDIANPARLVHEQQFDTNESIRFQPNISAVYEIIDGLTVSSSFMWDDREIKSTGYTPPNTTVQSGVLDADGNPTINPNESLSIGNFRNNMNLLEIFQTTQLLTFKKEFDKHSLNIVGGYELFEQGLSQNLRSTGNEGEVEPLDPTGEPFTLESYFVRTVYSYNNKYLFTGTVRRDGSSKFPPGQKWGTFPSFSIGWNVDQESFFPDINGINGIKLRASWGQLGNQAAISPAGFFTTLSPGYQYAFDNMNPSDGYASTFLAAKSLTWETSETTNFGIDLNLLQDKLTITAEYYQRKTKDLLVDRSVTPQPTFAGAQASSSNAASMQNDGVELTLDYQQNFSSFSLNLGGNISFVQNEVTGLGAGERITGKANAFKKSIDY